MNTSQSTDIRPFRIEIPQADLDDLRARLANTRWADPAPDAPSDFSRGVPVQYLKDLTKYWANDFDWRAQEARLNAYPQYLTEIDGQTIHFIHVRSTEPDATPLLMSHGYPGSVVEFLEMIDPLVNPVAYGGSPADAFHVVIPSIPGFGFSIPVSDAGWEVARTTSAFAELMRRLGYDRYGAHGGDVGAGITGRLAALYPESVIGTLINSDRGALGLAGDQFPIPDHLTESELAFVNEARESWKAERGYLELQSHRPETIAAALTDSPVAQLAWITEKFATWTNPSAELPEDAVNRDLLLTNITLYWLTRTGATAARFLHEAAHANLNWLAPSTVPTGWSIYNTTPTLRHFMDPKSEIPFWSDHKEGGHFAAMEAPNLLVEDLRAFFRQINASST
jgi:pimeloyl-ACP methyl ester carboxylesterase